MGKGEPVKLLVLVVSGCAEIDIGGGTKVTNPPGLLGEVSFLNGGDATATATLLPGCEYYSWEVAAIKAMLKKNPAAARGLDMKIVQEVSRKLADTNSMLVYGRDGFFQEEKLAQTSNMTAAGKMFSGI